MEAKNRMKVWTLTSLLICGTLLAPMAGASDEPPAQCLGEHGFRQIDELYVDWLASHWPVEATPIGEARGILIEAYYPKDHATGVVWGIIECAPRKDLQACFHWAIHDPNIFFDCVVNKE